MNRREMLLGSLSLAGAAVVANHLQAAESTHHHNHQHHHNDLIDAAAGCIQAGQVCLNHTLALLGDGYKEMAACAQSVNEMLAVCTALQALAAQQSTHLPQLAAIAEDVCVQCEKACAKHKEHEACRLCGERCAACAKACKKIAV